MSLHIFFYTSHWTSYGDSKCLWLLAWQITTVVLLVVTHWPIPIFNFMHTVHIPTWCVVPILTPDLLLDYSCHFVHSDTNLLGVDWISCSHWAMTILWQGFIDEQQMLWPTQCYSNKGKKWHYSVFQYYILHSLFYFWETCLQFCLCRQSKVQSLLV